MKASGHACCWPRTGRCRWQAALTRRFHSMVWHPLCPVVSTSSVSILETAFPQTLARLCLRRRGLMPMLLCLRPMECTTGGSVRWQRLKGWLPRCIVWLWATLPDSATHGWLTCIQAVWLRAELALRWNFLSPPMGWRARPLLLRHGVMAQTVAYRSVWFWTTEPGR